MQVSSTQWSAAEKEIVESAFLKAQHKEKEAVIQLVRQTVNEVSTLEDVWKLNDFLNSKRYEIEGKYDDQPAMLLFSLAALIKDGWLSLQELDGLDSDKLKKISALKQM